MVQSERPQRTRQVAVGTSNPVWVIPKYLSRLALGIKRTVLVWSAHVSILRLGESLEMRYAL